MSEMVCNLVEKLVPLVDCCSTASRLHPFAYLLSQGLRSEREKERLSEATDPAKPQFLRYFPVTNAKSLFLWQNGRMPKFFKLILKF